MKTLRKIGAALMAVVLSFGMVSCGDDNGIELDPTIKSTIVDDILKIVSDVIGAADSKTTPKEIAFKGAPAKKIVISDEVAIVYMDETKAIVDGENVYVCNYTVSGSNIVIENDELGSITVDLVKAMAEFAGKTYSCDVVDVPAAATPTAVSICRTWKNPSYQAAVFFDQLPIYGNKEKKSYTQIRALANEVAVKILAQDSKLTNDDFKLLSADIKTITFCANGVVYVTYTNNKVENSTWKWTNESKGQLATVIDGKDVALEARFEKGNPNKAYFVITANCEGIGGLGTKHTLSGKLVATVTD